MAYRDPSNSLYRSKDGAVIGGVCSGLSEKFKIDVTIIRILFVIALFGASAGFWIYVILWIALPEKNEL